MLNVAKDWMDDLTDLESIAGANEDLNRKIALKNKQILNTEHERDLSAHMKENNAESSLSAETRRLKEHNIRERREKGILTASDGIPENRLHNDSTDDDYSTDNDVLSDLMRIDERLFYNNPMNFLNKKI